MFGLGSGPVFLSDVHCTGSEATLLDCRHTIVSLGSYCTHNRDVGVSCEGEFNFNTIVLMLIGTVSILL